MSLFPEPDKKNLYANATFSKCGRYRYTLTRIWDTLRPLCGWIMLNPSVAGEIADDPTIRRCMGFARFWGYGGILVVNLFHLRATDPADLTMCADPIGPLDDVYHAVFDSAIERIMVGWGSHDVVAAFGRDIVIRGMAHERKRKLHCLAINADGSPRHPLYVRADVMPSVWFDSAAAKPSDD